MYIDTKKVCCLSISNEPNSKKDCSQLYKSLERLCCILKLFICSGNYGQWYEI